MSSSAIEHLVLGYYVGGLACLVLVVAACGSPAIGEAHGVARRKIATPLTVSKTLLSYSYAIGLLSALSVMRLKAAGERLVVLHLLRRLLETIWWPYAKTRKMPVIHALVGLSYHPILVMALLLSSRTNRPILRRDCWIVGVLSTAQSYLHYLLWRWQGHRRRGKAPHVPIADRHSWLFGWTLSPHYGLEVGIHVVLASLVGWAPLMCWNLAFVVTHRAILARSTAMWYRRRFPDAVNKPVI